MREEIILKSGAKLLFGEPSFTEASDLLEMVASEAIKVNVDLGDVTQYLQSQGDVSELLKDPKILNTLKNVVCQMLASKPFKAVLVTCMRRSLLNGEKISLATFEQNRADFLPVCWEVLKLTLAPFVGSLLSTSSTDTSRAKPSP